MHLALGVHALDDHLVHGATGDDVVYKNGAVKASLLLAGRPDALDDLQAFLQVPPVPEERELVAVVLQTINAVAHARGMSEPHAALAPLRRAQAV